MRAEPSLGLAVDLGNSGAANFLIHRVQISKFFDEQSRKKFQARMSEGILLVDSAEKEYGAEVYFWSGSSYQHQPVDPATDPVLSKLLI
jgi:hypothetical protein